jgi:hypothetical protein
LLQLLHERLHPEGARGKVGNVILREDNDFHDATSPLSCQGPFQPSSGRSGGRNSALRM